MVEFELDAMALQALNGGPHFKFNEAVSLSVRCQGFAIKDRALFQVVAAWIGVFRRRHHFEQLDLTALAQMGDFAQRFDLAHAQTMADLRGVTRRSFAPESLF